jgi:hypothetical protein
MRSLLMTVSNYATPIGRHAATVQKELQCSHGCLSELDFVSDIELD